MKKILIFSLAYHPHIGGAEVAIEEITKRLPEIEFHVLTLRFGDEPRVEKVGATIVHRIGFGSSYLAKMLFVPHAALKAVMLNRSIHFDGYWAMMSYMAMPVALLRLFGSTRPYVLTLQDGDPFEYVFERPQIRLFFPLLTYGFRHAAVTQTISHYLAGWAKTLHFVGPLEVVPNGVDARRFSNISGSREAVRKEWGRHMSDALLVSTSRLVHKNALDDVVRSLKLLPEHVHLYNFGAGPELPNLQTLAKELGVRERVHFMPHAPNAELPKYLQACDIFVRPSRSEGFGNSFVEAMAAGLPVIATQEGGLADFISPQTAFVVEKDSPPQIAERVDEILRNPERVKEVIETARKVVFEKYDWDTVAGAMRERVFSRLFHD